MTHLGKSVWFAIMVILKQEYCTYRKFSWVIPSKSASLHVFKISPSNILKSTRRFFKRELACAGPVTG